MSVQKRPTKRADGTTQVAWRVRWQEGHRWRSRTFDRKRDALVLDAELRRRRRLGALADLDAGSETLDAYVADVWVPTFSAQLAPKTRATYSAVYDRHISPTLGSVPLRSLTAEMIGRWQADRLAAGAGRSVVRKAAVLLGSILQRAAESGRIPTNPSRVVRKAAIPRREEVSPLSPATVELMRAAASPRDAALLSVLAYAGLRPGEALALRWADVRDRTLLVSRAAALGEIKATKTGQTRTVRLLPPLARDLAEWRMRCGRPDDAALVFPGHDGGVWSEAAWQSWRRRAFSRALAAAGVAAARPYDLRHSFASLLLHEGRSVIDVARQLGHGAALTLGTYGHVIAELEDAPRQSAESLIQAARETSAAPQLPIASGGSTSIG